MESVKAGESYDSDEWSSSHGEEEDHQSVGIKCDNGWDEEEAEKSECTSQSSWDEEEDEQDEVQSFLEETPEFRAKVQYQVRVVALIPGFENSGRKVSTFPHFYKLRFGKSLLEKTGFSSADLLCKSMPHVIQRQALDEHGQVLLVESPKNTRIVAGIRSGLRRIVFHVLRQYPKGVSAGILDEECSKLLARPLSVVLSELTYDTPNVECMVRDMADIASFRQLSTPGGSRVFLSSEAEDPTLTDGILVGVPRLHHSSKENGDSHVNEAVAEINDILQARFKMIVLLALHSRGLEINRLQKTFAELYTENLDCRVLGFSHIEELLGAWTDIALVQEETRKVFLRPSEKNSRLLKTLSSGLRLAVFSTLLKCYPDGLEPAQVVSHLQQSQILEAYGEELELHQFCFVVDDMMDFIRFGSQEDGTLVLKLRDSSFPVVELPECSQADDDEIAKLCLEGEESAASPKVVQLAALYPPVVEVENDDDNGDGEMETSGEALEQQLRLILGSPAHAESGLLLPDLVSVYKERSGRSLNATQVKSFASRTPGLLRMSNDRVWLIDSPRNSRIVWVTRAGLRQVLYWALVKNPGGVWSELLEGWFTDFTGYSLEAILRRHGYRASSKEPLLPVCEFLHDMGDLCKGHSNRTVEFFTLAGGRVEDPVEGDSRLLGLSSGEIEYNPVKLCLELDKAVRGRLGAGEKEEDGQHSEISMEQEPFPEESEEEEEEEEEEVEEKSNGYDPPKAYATPLVVPS
ncbi:hypothetical protein SELMODRAFT_411392 [Selaginella moellendorffii]|uniref:HTH OST-type domain-containing protein n=1 Tax=Selaginella moellendorffii TaxID=88036 RepID=D8RHH5_SELML|nr:uncharacterized protein LOC9631969 [Selaginella moellendorffii]EFJ28529.1 hypothetical protein SELMODRAFT_411392 [Selaginella moellendorffii]|eukprot:XP_002970399.1 uncharacterized protein LOC9631969 [Selaginella moellendorffii]